MKRSVYSIKKDKMFKNNPYVVLYRLLRQHCDNKPKFLLTTFFFVCSNIIGAADPYVIGMLMTTIQLGGKEQLPTIMIYLVLLGAIPLVDWIFHGTARVREEKLKFGITTNFRMRLFDMVMALPMSRHTEHHSGETIDQVNKAVSALQEFSGNTFLYMSTVLRFLTSIVMLTWIRPIIGATIFVVGVCIFVFIWVVDKKLVARLEEQNTLGHKVASLTYDYISNIKTIITLRFEKGVRGTLYDAIGVIFSPFKKYTVLNERKWFAVSITLALSTAATVGFYIYQQYTVAGVVLVGTVTMLFQYIMRMSDSFYNFAWQYSQVVQNRINAQTVDHIVASYNELVKKHNVPHFRNRSHIDIAHLSFSYRQDGKAKEVLNDISMHIHAGEKIAFVGASGCGKSTFMMLLRGLYDVDHAEITIDGTNVDGLHVLAYHTSLIPQDPEIFENTIRYNITVGTEVDDEKLQKALHLAAFDEVVEQLPKGLESDIREKGVNLSGGQKQRLALARGILLSEESDILLLDEPTSSVDPVNEQAIYKRIFDTYREKTIISALHKLHLVGLFDTIYVFEKGKIVEHGSFDYLVQKKGVFAHMRSAYQEGIAKQQK